MIGTSPTAVSRHRGVAIGTCIAVLTLGAAACGSKPASSANQIASLGSQPASSDASNATDGSSPGTTDASGGKKTDPTKAFADYAKCMRGEGIDMPDPQVVKAGSSTSGGVLTQISLDPTAETGPSRPPFDPESDDYKAADATCKHFIDDVVGQINVDPAQQAEQRKQALAFAKCMRDHGIDFPDPTFQDGGGVTIKIDDSGSNGIKPDSAAFQAAQDACGKLMGDGMFTASNGGKGPSVAVATPGT